MELAKFKEDVILFNQDDHPKDTLLCKIIRFIVTSRNLIEDS